MSLEAQAKKIRAMGSVHDAEVEIVADDGETGKNTNRPRLERVPAAVVDRGQARPLETQSQGPR